MSWWPADQRSDLLAEGQGFEAVVIGHDNDRRELVLSKKAADPNPLAAFHARHPDGADVDGQVHRILASGDLVLALEGGVEGLMPARLAPRAKASDELTAGWELKVGDWVRGRKQGLDATAGRVRLDGLAAQAAAEAGFAARSGPSAPPPPATATALPAGRTASGLVVLLVEDDADIREPAEFYLRGRGHAVRSAGSRADAERLIATADELDVAVVDLQLHGEAGGPLLARVRERFPNARVVLLTGNPAAVREPLLRLADRLVPKPVPAEELVGLVESHARDAAPPRPAVLDEGVIGLLAEPTDDPLPSAARRLVDDHLRAVADLFPRAKVALLARDAARTEVRCVRAFGAAADVFQRFARQLAASPVEDVLDEDRLPIRVGPPRPADPSPFAAFLSALGARGLIGLPVPAEAAPLPLGLFVFLPTDDGCDPDRVTRLHVRVDALAVALDRAVLNAQLLQNQRAMCAGGLFLAITHELTNGLNAIINQLGRARGGLEGQLPSTVARPAVAAAHERSKRLMGVFDDLLGTVRPRGRTGAVPLAEVLRRVADATRSTAAHHGVRLTFPAADPRAAGLPVAAVVEQAVFNLVLNAVQHTGAYRTANGLGNGQVTATVGCEADDGAWAVVRVTDNGPGIDGASFGRVFDMYHTTRRRGSGLGLYVTRTVAESHGGRVEVERSVKFVETTFALRLPIR